MSSNRSVMINLIAVIVLAVGTLASSNFRCPPASDISPCECHIRPHKLVRCVGGGSMSFDSALAIIHRHFEGVTTIPRLILSEMGYLFLTFRGRRELRFKSFSLSDSTIRFAEKDAFHGQTSLSVVILQNDSLTHVPTEALQQLTSLRSLSLAGNLLERIRDGSLNNLYSVKMLELQENRISEIDNDAFPQNLESLVISRNRLSTFNRSLQFLEHLEEVHASHNKVKSVRGEFYGLFRLQILYLDHNRISDISDGFSDLTSLTRLSLSGNQIKDVGEDLSGLNQLIYLNLSHNAITKLHQTTFENQKDLQVLDLSGNFITAIGICRTIRPLRFLLELKLSDMRLKKLRRKCFYDMENLLSLDLSRNQLSALWYVMKYPNNLIYLDISFNNFSYLKTLRLSNNKDLALLKMEGNPWQYTNQTTSMLRDLEEKGFMLQGHPGIGQSVRN